MKRTLAVLLSAALLAGAADVSATARHPDDGVVCDQQAMGTLLTLGYGVFDGSPYVRCQFRLFIPHTTPHVWTENEYFHGGDFWFLTPEDIETLGMSRGDVIRYFGQIEERLFWGKANTPDAQLNELKLKRTAIIELGEDLAGLPAGTFIRETYFVFAPQEPGLYKWRYEFADPLFGSYPDVTSEVCIEPVEKGKGKPLCPQSPPPIDG